MDKLFQTLLALALAFASATASAETKLKDVGNLVVSMGTSTSGLVYVSPCDGCATLLLHVTAETVAVRGGHVVSLSELVSWDGRAAAIHYDTDTKDIQRIELHPEVN